MRNDCSPLHTTLPRCKKGGHCYFEQTCHGSSWLRPHQAIHWRKRLSFVVLICGNKYLWCSQISDDSNTKDWVKYWDVLIKPSLDFLIRFMCSICSVVFHNLNAKGFPNLHVKMNSFCHWIYFSWPNSCSLRLVFKTEQLFCECNYRKAAWHNCTPAPSYMAWCPSVIFIHAFPLNFSIGFAFPFYTDWLYLWK